MSDKKRKTELAKFKTAKKQVCNALETSTSYELLDRLESILDANLSTEMLSEIIVLAHREGQRAGQRKMAEEINSRYSQ